jgi:hypothetical protein
MLYPITVVPSRKLTVPEGDPDGDTPVTVAVKVTGVPGSEGFKEELIDVLLVPAPVAFIAKPVNRLDDPVGVLTENCRCPVVAVPVMLIVTGRLVEVPPDPTVAVTPVPVNTRDVAPDKLVPLMTAGYDAPCCPDVTDMDAIIGCELPLASSTWTLPE